MKLFKQHNTQPSQRTSTVGVYFCAFRCTSIRHTRYSRVKAMRKHRKENVEMVKTDKNAVVIEDSVLEDSEVYDDLVAVYQEDPSPMNFGNLYESVRQYLYRLTKQQHAKVIGYGIERDKVRQEINIALWKSAEKFDGSKGSNFISYLKQYVSWRISDYIIRPYHSVKNKSNQDMLSIDVQDVYGDTLLDSVEVTETHENDVVDSEMFMEVKELIEQFKSYGTKADYNVVKIVFSILLEKGNADNDTVNEALYEEYSDLARGSVRSKKTRGLNKFKEFCELDGSTVNIEEII